MHRIVSSAPIRYFLNFGVPRAGIVVKRIRVEGVVVAGVVVACAPDTGGITKNRAARARTGNSSIARSPRISTRKIVETIFCRSMVISIASLD